jgi:hypothetical protein
MTQMKAISKMISRTKVRPIAMRISVWEDGEIAMVDSYLFTGDEERSASMDKSERWGSSSTKQQSRRFSEPQQTRARLLIGWQLNPLFQIPNISSKKKHYLKWFHFLSNIELPKSSKYPGQLLNMMII